jgi:protein virilizer
LNYQQVEDSQNVHPIVALQRLVGKTIKNKEEVLSEDDFEENLKAINDYLNESKEETSLLNSPSSDSQADAPQLLPQAEGIVTQFASRPILKICNKQNHNGQLDVNFWLTPPSFEEEILSEQTNFDLLDTIQLCLPVETNLTLDCKRLLHLSASPQSNRDRTTACCFRTRRVEVEKTTGRLEKKVYGKK